MKLTIELDRELEFAMQNSLDTGTPVQTYVRAALKFYNDMYKTEKSGKMIGFGDPTRFKSYNTEASPEAYLQTEIE